MKIYIVHKMRKKGWYYYDEPEMAPMGPFPSLAAAAADALKFLAAEGRFDIQISVERNIRRANIRRAK